MPGLMPPQISTQRSAGQAMRRSVGGMTSASRTPAASRPVAKLSTPGDIVATIPSLCGFLPSDSVILLSLRGPRKRLGLTIRLDLPAADAEPDAAELLAERVAADGGAAAVVVVYGGRRRAGLVDAVSAALGGRGIEVTEALHVDDGRWTSYVCARSCCPPEGTPVPAPPSLVQAQRALDGRAVLGSREELVRSMAPPGFLQAQVCLQALEQAERQWLQERHERGDEDVRTEVLAQARELVTAVGRGAVVDLPHSARLAIGLHDVLVRDEVSTWALKRSDAVLATLEQVARQTPAPYDAPVCTMLAWVAHARGDGSRANVALDRALMTDPSYSLALLLRQALDAAIPPREIRTLLRGTRRALRTGSGLSSPG
jgi:hypothetical protein